MPEKTNRFSKSVKNAEENTKINIKEDEKRSVENSMKVDIIENMKEYVEKNVNSKILDNIFKEEKKKGSTHALYLSSEVGDAIAILAKNKKISKSQIVDKILKEVFSL